MLRKVREDFENGRLARDPRHDPTARQAFVALHRRLYARLGELVVTGALDRVGGVLVERNGTLEFVVSTDALHDDGMQSAVKRHFLSAVAFAILPRDMSIDDAAKLGIRTFRVTTEMKPPAEQPEDQTSLLRATIDELAPLILALQVHTPVRGQPIDPGSDAFRSRAVRLSRLQVFRVQDLGLTLRIEGTSIEHVIGEGQAGDMFVEGATTALPKLFHDFPVEQTQELTRRSLDLSLREREAKPCANLVDRERCS